VEVITYPVPETPVIQQQGDSLISQSSQGNQWYNNTGPIPGATGQVFYPAVENDYFVLVTNESGCISDTSNIIHFIFTGLDDLASSSEILVFPNPFHETLTVHLAQEIKKNIVVSIYNIMGNEMASYNFETTGLQEDIILSTGRLKSCLYLLKISDQKGNILLSKKIIKN